MFRRLMELLPVMHHMSVGPTLIKKARVMDEIKTESIKIFFIYIHIYTHITQYIITILFWDAIGNIVS